MHTEWVELISASIDGELDPVTEARLEQHLVSCPECARVRADLERLVGAASDYRGSEPPRDLWPAISRGIDDSRVVEFKTPSPSRFARLMQLAVAAVALIAVGVGGALWFESFRVGDRPVPSVDPAPAMVPATHKEIAGRDYDDAVIDLERALATNRSRLDSSTVRVVEESLRTIDRAIAEARAAIQRDSANEYLNDQIAANMRRKLALLRSAARAVSKES